MSAAKFCSFFKIVSLMLNFSVNFSNLFSFAIAKPLLPEALWLAIISLNLLFCILKSFLRFLIENLFCQLILTYNFVQIQKIFLFGSSNFFAFSTRILLFSNLSIPSTFSPSSIT